MNDQDFQDMAEEGQVSEEEKKSKEYETVKQSVVRIANYLVSITLGIGAFLAFKYWINGYIDSDYWTILLILYPIALVIRVIIEYVNYNRYHIANKG